MGGGEGCGGWIGGARRERDTGGMDTRSRSNRHGMGKI